MNVAFPALLVFLLLLPGFLFRNAFKRAERTTLDWKPFGQAVTASVLTAFFLNGLWYLLTLLVTRSGADFGVLLTLLLGDRSQNADAAIGKLTADPWHPFAFLGTLYVVSAAGCRALRHLVTRYQLDRRDSPIANLVRFNTPWYYLFTGYDQSPRPDGVYVSAVVNFDDGSYIYSGILVEYFLNDEGQLDRLVLTSAARRRLSEDAPEDDADDLDAGFYPIAGDYLVLRYSEMVTLNVSYIRIVQGDADVADDAEVDRDDRNEEGHA